MNLADLVLLVAATTSLTRLMTHDTITTPLRHRAFARGGEDTTFVGRMGAAPGDPPRPPKGRRWEALESPDGRVAGWYRPDAWYVRMLECPRFCAPVWAGAAVAGLWLVDFGPSRWPVVALGLRGIHATVWPLVADQFGES